MARLLNASTSSRSTMESMLKKVWGLNLLLQRRQESPPCFVLSEAVLSEAVLSAAVLEVREPQTLLI